MCLIIAQNRKHETVPFETFEKAWRINDDGGGFAFNYKGGVKICKPFHSVRRFYSAYSRARERFPAASFIVHFRYTTHGKNNVVNTHPHPVHGGKAALAHNGILAGYGDSKISDTVEFCRTVVDNIPLDVFKIPRFKKDFGKLIGPGNKLAVLFGDGDLSIVNESEGAADRDGWFSNNLWDSSYSYFWDKDTNTLHRYYSRDESMLKGDFRCGGYSCK